MSIDQYDNFCYEEELERVLNSKNSEEAKKDDYNKEFDHLKETEFNFEEYKVDEVLPFSKVNVNGSIKNEKEYDDVLIENLNDNSKLTEKIVESKKSNNLTKNNNKWNNEREEVMIKNVVIHKKNSQSQEIVYNTNHPTNNHYHCIINQSYNKLIPKNVSLNISTDKKNITHNPPKNYNKICLNKNIFKENKFVISKLIKSEKDYIEFKNSLEKVLILKDLKVSNLDCNSNFNQAIDELTNENLELNRYYHSLVQIHRVMQNIDLPDNNFKIHNKSPKNLDKFLDKYKKKFNDLSIRMNLISSDNYLSQNEKVLNDLISQIDHYENENRLARHSKKRSEIKFERTYNIPIPVDNKKILNNYNNLKQKFDHLKEKINKNKIIISENEVKIHIHNEDYDKLKHIADSLNIIEDISLKNFENLYKYKDLSIYRDFLFKKLEYLSKSNDLLKDNNEKIISNNLEIISTLKNQKNEILLSNYEKNIILVKKKESFFNYKKNYQTTPQKSNKSRIEIEVLEKKVNQTMIDEIKDLNQGLSDQNETRKESNEILLKIKQEDDISKDIISIKDIVKIEKEKVTEKLNEIDSKCNEIKCDNNLPSNEDQNHDENKNNNENVKNNLLVKFNSKNDLITSNEINIKEIEKIVNEDIYEKLDTNIIEITLENIHTKQISFMDFNGMNDIKEKGNIKTITNKNSLCNENVKVNCENLTNLLEVKEQFNKLNKEISETLQIEEINKIEVVNQLVEQNKLNDGVKSQLKENQIFSPSNHKENRFRRDLVNKLNQESNAINIKESNFQNELKINYIQFDKKISADITQINHFNEKNRETFKTLFQDDEINEKDNKDKKKPKFNPKLRRHTNIVLSGKNNDMDQIVEKNIKKQEIDDISF